MKKGWVILILVIGIALVFSVIYLIYFSSSPILLGSPEIQGVYVNRYLVSSADFGSLQTIGLIVNINNLNLTGLIIEEQIPENWQVLSSNPPYSRISGRNITYLLWQGGIPLQTQTISYIVRVNSSDGQFKGTFTSVDNSSVIQGNGIINVLGTCIENWSCGAWSSCSNNQQNRTCSETNQCGTTIYRPDLTQACESSYIFVADYYNNRTLKFNSLGNIVGSYQTNNYPTRVAIDANKNLWVLNNTALVKLNSSGALVGTYNTGNSPNYIAVDANNNIWVANGGGNSVTKFSNSGAIIGTYNVGIAPRGIAVDSNNNIWVANFGTMTPNVHGSVMKLSNSGTILGTYTASPNAYSQTMSQPTAIAVDANNNIWVGDYDTSRGAMKLSNLGVPLGAYNTNGNSNSIAVDANNNIWVASLSNIVKLNNSGTKLGTYIITNHLSSISVDNENNIWVANTYGDNGIIKLNNQGTKLGNYSFGSVPASLSSDFALKHFVLGSNNTITPTCIENWSCGAWIPSPCSSGQQIRTCSDSNNCGTTINKPNLTQVCTTQNLCTVADWSSTLSPADCPATRQQTRTWNKIGNCENGVNHPATETISCIYNIPTCTDFTYSDWSSCSSSGIKSRSVLSASPANCQGGNPILTQSCATNTNSADTNNDGKVDTNELISFIDVWMKGNATITELLSTIDKWLNQS